MRVGKIFLFLISMLIIQTQSYGQGLNLRLLSLGSASLVFEDSENELNVYDFGKNPAGLVADQKHKWMRYYNWSDYFNGDFRREMDPQKRMQSNIGAEGVNPIGENATFRGFVQYYVEDLKNVYRGLEYEPYRDIFTPVDTTTGSFDYYGPKLGFEYARNVNSWLSFGGSLTYRLQDGLKRESSKMKIDGRMIFGTLGARIVPFKNISIGLAFRPFSVQYRLNANKLFLLDHPVIHKFYGDSLLIKNEKVSTYNRRTQSEGYGAEGVFVYHFASWLTLAGKGGYDVECEQIDEGTSDGQLEIDDYGSWQSQGIWVESQWRINPPGIPFKFGICINWRDWNSWARTPRYETVFEEMEGDWSKYGIGVAYSVMGLPMTIGLEYHETFFYERKDNYYDGQ